MKLQLFTAALTFFSIPYVLTEKCERPAIAYLGETLLVDTVEELPLVCLQNALYRQSNRALWAVKTAEAYIAQVLPVVA